MEYVIWIGEAICTIHSLHTLVSSKLQELFIFNVSFMHAYDIFHI
jgi:hypothetical protein